MIVELATFFFFSAAVMLGLRANPRWAPGILFIASVYTWMLLSNIVIEQGVYITEQQRMSQPIGAYFILLGYIGCFLFGYFVAARLLGSYLQQVAAIPRAIDVGTVRISSASLDRALFAAIAAILLLMMMHTVISGSPLLRGSDTTKFTFWEDAARLPRLQIVNNQLFALIFAYAVVARRRLRILVLVMLGLSHFALLGHRFSALILLVYFAGYPALQYFAWASIITPRLLGMVSAFLVLTGTLTYMTYSVETRYEGAEIVKFAFYRVFVLQGHTWWGVVDFVNQHGAIGDPARFLSEDSMRYIMRLIAPAGLYRAYIESHSSFTMAYPAFLHLTLGFWAMPLQLVIGGGFALVVLGLHTVARLGFIGAFLAMKLFLVWFFVLVSGSTMFLVDPDWIWFLLLLIMYLAMLGQRRAVRSLQAGA